MTTSKVTTAEDLFMTERFDTRGLRAVSPLSLADIVDATQVEIEGWLNSLEAQGFLARLRTPGTSEDCFEPTPSGSREREHLLRSRGLRHPALTGSGEDLVPIVIAILMAGRIENERLTGGMIGQEESLTPAEIAAYLPQIPIVELEKAITEGVNAGFFRHGAKLYREFGSPDLQHVGALVPTERGRQKYLLDVTTQLGLGRTMSILDLRVIDTLFLFNSWQSEFNPSRSAIDKALKDVVKEVNEISGLVRPLRIVCATQAGDGAVRIDVELLNRIRTAHLFVGDLTPIVECEGRLRLNDNVLIEVGYALASKDPDQVILVSKCRPELEQNGAHIAFDIAHVRRHTFKSGSDLKVRLRTEIEAALRRKGWLS